MQNEHNDQQGQNSVLTFLTEEAAEISKKKRERFFLVGRKGLYILVSELSLLMILLVYG
jgi:hypothetical protein